MSLHGISAPCCVAREDAPAPDAEPECRAHAHDSGEFEAHRKRERCVDAVALRASHIGPDSQAQPPTGPFHDKIFNFIWEHGSDRFHFCLDCTAHQGEV